MHTILTALIGSIGGIASGLLGIGGAVIMVPALVFILGFTQHNAQGTTLIAMIPPIGILAAIEYYKAGHADIKTAAIIAAFFIVGAFLGSKIALKIDPYYLKKMFGVVLLYISIRMIVS
ncbi:MAG TPA: sulfite exporter TauE/SafE family protein [Spirochaetota bacterium]|nr:sulfite exporter TauE/SafE family protein [Spirochaetota bacterium]HPJ33977.1 sulfite exporter TauE/SafE family protein [Spirochaetota bacterium]